MDASKEVNEDEMAEWGVEGVVPVGEGALPFSEDLGFDGSGENADGLQDAEEDGEMVLPPDAGEGSGGADDVQPEQENGDDGGGKGESEVGEGFLSTSDLEKDGDMADAKANGDAVHAEDSDIANGKLENEQDKGEDQNGIDHKEEFSGMNPRVSTGKKRKGMAAENGASNGTSTATKKPKKKNAWSKSSSRKGSKKQSNKAAQARSLENENTVYICPTLPHMEKAEDGPSVPILLSKICKAERVELSADRLSAGSTKGFRMVQATRGVVEGAWFFEITVEKLGPTGHTRLGWCTKKADIQAPVGYDIHGYSYRDLEGSKVHSALREPYGEAYVEGDVVGFYINLPNGRKLAPRPPEIVAYKGASYYIEPKDEPLQRVSDSEICFFRNGICQGTAFSDILAGRYYPAASMYTLPGEPNCTVRFNFGPNFHYPPVGLGDRPVPLPMSSAPFCGPNGQEINAEGSLIEPLLADDSLRVTADTTPVPNGDTTKSER